MRLCLRQDSAGTDVFIDLPAGGQYYCIGSDGCSVTVRFDRLAPKDIDAGTPGDGSDDTLFLYHEDDLVRAILGAKSMIVEAPLYQAGNQQLRFNVAGLRWEVPKVAEQAGPALSAAPPLPRPISFLADPKWTSKPGADDVARYYPERAQRLEASGTATIECSLTGKGTLTGCSVASEMPADMGFGDAAMKMAMLYKVAPRTPDGASLEGARVSATVAFALPRD